MKRFAVRNIYLLIAVPIFLVLLLCEFVFFIEINHKQEAQRVYKVFEKKEKRLKVLVDSVVFNLNVSPEVLTNWSLLRLFNPDNEELAITISSENALLFWSSSLVAFPAGDSSIKKSEGLIHLPTGSYYQISHKAGAYFVRGFLLVKREFSYRNRFIKSSFNDKFKLPDDYLVQSDPQPDALNVSRPDGTHLFSITTNNEVVRVVKSDLTAWLYFALVLTVLAHLNVWLKRDKKISPDLKLIIPLGISVIIYLIFNVLKFPISLYQTNLFSPRDFAFSSWLASLGEFILLSVLMFHAAQTFFLLSMR